MGTKKMRWVAVLSLLMLGMGCGGEEGSFFVPPDGVFEGQLYIGTLEGTDAMAAFAVRDGNVVGYVCGGDSTFATHSRWFCGQADPVDGGFHIVVEEAAWTLDAIIDANAVHGTVRSPDGIVTPVDAFLDGPGSGLFADQVGGCSTGVIVAASESGETSVYGTYCADDFGHFEQVTPVRPVEAVPNALDVHIGEDELPMTVFRVQP